MTSQPGQSTTADQSTCTSDRNWLAIAHQAVKYRGAIQHPTELAALLGLLAGQVRPVRVLEIGGAHGGTAWAWLQLPTVRQVITVDLPDPALGNTVRSIDPRHFVIEANSRSTQALLSVSELLGRDHADMVFIDGGHDYETAMSDWRVYGVLKAAGGIVALHDILPWEDHPEMQVDAVWAKIRPGHDTIELIARPGSRYGIGVVFT